MGHLLRQPGSWQRFLRVLAACAASATATTCERLIGLDGLRCEGSSDAASGGSGAGGNSTGGGGSSTGGPCGATIDCTEDAYCGSGYCQPKRSDGLGCSAQEECLGAACIEGICCVPGQIAPTLSVSGLSSGSHLGASIGLSPNALIVGAPYANSTTHVGRAFVWSLPLGEMTELSIEGLPEDAHFGQSVAIRGATAVVGSDGDVSGGAHVFKSPSYAADGILSAGSSHAFGAAMAMDGETLVIGAPWMLGVTGSNVVQVCQVGASVECTNKLEGEPPTDSFGYKVAVSEDTLAVLGVAPELPASWRLFVFERNDLKWDQKAMLYLGGAVSFENPSVAISKDIVLVGIGNPPEVFGFQRTDSWAPIARSAEPLNAIPAGCGLGVAAAGDLVAVGCGSSVVVLARKSGTLVPWPASQPTGGYALAGDSALAVGGCWVARGNSTANDETVGLLRPE